MILSTTTSQLLVIDVQEKLAPAMSDAGPVIEHSARLVTAARHFALPVTISEQYPRGIGPTVENIREAAGNEARYFEKLAFSCLRDATIAAHLNAQERRQIVEAPREIALRRMEQAGVHPVTTEMVIFEWLGRAGTPDFKALLPLIK